jgi:hypothetical protein
VKRKVRDKEVEAQDLEQQLEAIQSFGPEDLKIRNKNGELVALQPNRSQTQFKREAGRRNIVLKARQVGITTWIAARFFLHTIQHPGTMTVQVAHDHSSAEAIFRIVHRFLENLPEEMRAGALKTSRANVRQIRFRELDSEYRVESAADLNAGRGLTIHNLHCSEVARWPREAVEALASLRAAVVPQGEIVLESTPNGAGGSFYEEWQSASETGYVRHFFPWWLEDSYQRPAGGLKFTEEEEELRRKVEKDFGQKLSCEQIAFRREIRRQFGKRAPQEFAEDAESCFLASGECLFDVEVVERQLKASQPPLESHDRAQLLVWLTPVHDGKYVIGVDPAGGGTKGDFACAQVVHRESGLQCAELYGHYSPKELAEEVAALGRRFNDAMIAVERMNHGHGVLMYLREVARYANLYQARDQDGWDTNALTRVEMINWLVTFLDQQPGLFQSERLLRECRAFVRRADGSGEAAPGAHDDAVMAMAIAQYVRREIGQKKGVRSVTDGAGNQRLASST